MIWTRDRVKRNARGTYHTVRVHSFVARTSECLLAVVAEASRYRCTILHHPPSPWKTTTMALFTNHFLSSLIAWHICGLICSHARSGQLFLFLFSSLFIRFLDSVSYRLFKFHSAFPRDFGQKNVAFSFRENRTTLFIFVAENVLSHFQSILKIYLFTLIVRFLSFCSANTSHRYKWLALFRIRCNFLCGLSRGLNRLFAGTLRSYSNAEALS